MIENAVDFEIRKNWDTVLYDFRTFYMSKDYSYSRVSYAFKSPFPVADRDFYIEQLCRKDYPEPGMCTIHVQSLPANEVEMPAMPKRIRGTIQIIGFILKPVVDTTNGEIYHEVFMTNCIDINGQVPKWLCNASSKTVPRHWFKTFELGCVKDHQRREEEKAAQGL